MVTPKSPIPAKTNKTSDTTKQMSNEEEITGRLPSPSLLDISEVEAILEANTAEVIVYIESTRSNTLIFILV